MKISQTIETELNFPFYLILKKKKKVTKQTSAKPVANKITQVKAVARSFVCRKEEYQTWVQQSEQILIFLIQLHIKY